MQTHPEHHGRLFVDEADCHRQTWLSEVDCRICLLYLYRTWSVWFSGTDVLWVVITGGQRHRVWLWAWSATINQHSALSLTLFSGGILCRFSENSLHCLKGETFDVVFTLIGVEWGLLFPSANGEYQSPINLNSREAQYDPSLLDTVLAPNYVVCRDCEVINDGHTVRIILKSKSGECRRRVFCCRTAGTQSWESPVAFSSGGRGAAAQRSWIRAPWGPISLGQRKPERIRAHRQLQGFPYGGSAVTHARTHGHTPHTGRPA